jgi:hypothetical protein
MPLKGQQRKTKQNTARKDQKWDPSKNPAFQKAVEKFPRMQSLMQAGLEKNPKYLDEIGKYLIFNILSSGTYTDLILKIQNILCL